MTLISWLYEKISRRRTSKKLKECGVLKLIWGTVRKFLNVSVIPFIPITFLRVLGYRMLGYRIGRGVFIGMQCYLDDVHPDRTIIEDAATVSYRVTFAVHGPGLYGDTKIIIRKGAYIGTAAVILGGVEIGDGATVAAGAVVTRDVLPKTLVAGVPARLLAPREGPYSPLKTSEMKGNLPCSAGEKGPGCGPADDDASEAAEPTSDCDEA